MSHPDPNLKRLSKAEDWGFMLAVFIPLSVLCAFSCAEVLRKDTGGMNWFAVLFFLGPLSLPPVLFVTGSRPFFTAACAVLIPLEVLAAFLADYTLIGVASMFPLLLLWANLIPVGLQLSKRESAQLAPWILMVLIGVSILPRQAWLGVKLLKLEYEAKRIIAYSYEYKLQTGTFPADLSGYSWRYSSLSNHFGYQGHGTDDKFTYPFKDDPQYDASDKFSIRYYVGNKDTAYWYSSKKGWFVEDD